MPLHNMSDLASAFNRGLNNQLQAPIAPKAGFPCDANRAIEEMHHEGVLARGAMYEDDGLTPAEQEIAQEELAQSTFAFMEDAINAKDKVWYS